MPGAPGPRAAHGITAVLGQCTALCLCLQCLHCTRTPRTEPRTLHTRRAQEARGPPRQPHPRRRRAARGARTVPRRGPAPSRRMLQGCFAFQSLGTALAAAVGCAHAVRAHASPGQACPLPGVLPAGAELHAAANLLVGRVLNRRAGVRQPPAPAWCQPTWAPACMGKAASR